MGVLLQKFENHGSSVLINLPTLLLKGWMSLTTADYQTINKIDVKTKQLVHGYFRKTVQLIPISIIEICLLFYYYFKIPGHTVEISGDYDDIITKIESTDWWNMSYGSIWINSMSQCIVQWTFKILDKGEYKEVSKSYDDITIGIINSDSHRSHERMAVWNIAGEDIISYTFKTSANAAKCNGKTKEDYGLSHKEVF